MARLPHMFEEMLAEPENVYDLLSKRRDAFTSHLRREGLNLPSAEVLRNTVTRLGESTTLAYSDSAAPEPEIDERAMTSSHLITTPAEDRYGDKVMPRGLEPHVANYLKNPVVFFGHKSYDLPIALSSPPQISEAGIRAVAKYHGDTAESTCVFGLVAKKILRATSIGFLPVKAAILRNDNIDEEGKETRPKKTPDGEKVVYFDPWFSLKFLEWEMLEWSIVSVPANPECVDSLTSFLSKGSVDGEKIPSSIRKSLEPFTLRARVWSPGFNPQSQKYSGVMLLGDKEIEYKNGELTRLGEISLVQSAVDEEPAATFPSPAIEEIPLSVFVPAPVVEQQVASEGMEVKEMTSAAVVELAADVSTGSGGEDMSPEMCDLLTQVKEAMQELYRALLEHTKNDADRQTELLAKMDELLALERAEQARRRDDDAAKAEDAEKQVPIAEVVKMAAPVPVPSPVQLELAQTLVAMKEQMNNFRSEMFKLTGKRI